MRTNTTTATRTYTITLGDDTASIEADVFEVEATSATEAVLQVIQRLTEDVDAPGCTSSIYTREDGTAGGYFTGVFNYAGDQPTRLTFDIEAAKA